MSEPESSIHIHFEDTNVLPPIIKVFGVGGGGSNAVNHMYKQGITGVEFVVCNTDLQSLGTSPVPNRLQIGAGLTEGRGAGNSPEIGRNAALEDADDIREVLSKSTKMVFITAGMGGGTGTGAAPVIAQVAKELDILTVGIVTTPFGFEGTKRKNQASQGIEEMRKYVDSLIIINNDKVREHYGNLKLSEAFSKADDILTVAAKGISELITVTGYMNVDFEDVKTVMKNSGMAIMGTGVAEGEDRAHQAVEMALNSPLLNDNEIYGARNILLYIASGDDEISMDEVSDISDYIQNAAGSSAEIIWGNGTDHALGNSISVTVVATNFTKTGNPYKPANEEAKFITLQQDVKSEMQQVEEAEPEMKVVVKQVEEQPVVNTYQPPVIPTVEQPVEKITIQLDPQPLQENNHDSSFMTAMEQQQNPQQIILDMQPQDNNQEEEQLQTPIRPELQDDRMQNLKNFNFTNPKVTSLDEIEQVPAYARRGVNLTPENPSDEKIVSRFTLGENGDRKPEIRENNSFLHDNVD
ncbi:Cell division protein FtsZ [bioreactor metagenome]|uniref:Cell division protein FtsZ n=1 Tax=bioreactor metagenome TaxID=1076179 RepID=A0A644W1K1_9ZZZZ